ncbi:MAG: hypothetical protein RLZZ252_192 [Bacteroidota bacterium]|jgi:hypothetical protein
MNSKTILWMLLGLVIAFALPLGLGILIALAQQVKPDNFLWAVANMRWFYNSIYQLAIAANIGVFFLIMRVDEVNWPSMGVKIPGHLLVFFGRGWLIATIAHTLWAVIIELGKWSS